MRVECGVVMFALRGGCMSGRRCDVEHGAL